jgi:1,4-alpha-glucan branching enzyme
MSAKYFSLVLHSHIPYVLAHGSWPHGMDWLYEAAAESYLPLLRVFERLQKEGLPPASTSPLRPSSWSSSRARASRLDSKNICR